MTVAAGRITRSSADRGFAPQTTPVDRSRAATLEGRACSGNQALGMFGRQRWAWWGALIYAIFSVSLYFAWAAYQLGYVLPRGIAWIQAGFLGERITVSANFLGLERSSYGFRVFMTAMSGTLYPFILLIVLFLSPVQRAFTPSEPDIVDALPA